MSPFPLYGKQLKSPNKSAEAGATGARAGLKQAAEPWEWLRSAVTRVRPASTAPQMSTTQPRAPGPCDEVTQTKARPLRDVDSKDGWLGGKTCWPGTFSLGGAGDREVLRAT